MPNTDTYVGFADVCRILGVCEGTIFNWVKASKMPEPAIVSPRGWRLWLKSEIEELARQRAEDRRRAGAMSVTPEPSREADA